jgi:deoxycytidylate deaminase
MATISVVGKATKPASLNGKDAGEEITSRYSQELVIGLSGPVGCGIQHVHDVLEAVLKSHGYEVVPIKISKYFSRFASDLGLPDPTKNIREGDEFERISKSQDLGNSLRSALGDDVGAQIALSAIAHDRTVRHPNIPVQDIRPERVAYIVDQLKNPKEAGLLRDVYGNMFYLIGVLSGYERRKSNLIKMMNPTSAESLIERDRAEENGGGQQLEKTLKMSDYFVRNSNDNTQELKKPLERFIGLVHGENGITPTINERGMYAAFSAALRSACLSRQVGASIIDEHGNIISTGCNDVPKPGGGLYETGQTDNRCVFKEGGICFNDKYKDKLRDEILKILKSDGINELIAEKLSDRIRSETRLRDLIEFSRAVHAEMDALISAARKGGTGVQGCTLFTTTYPCHNCARHIVAAGIKAVYFIEPYGKSLASELHDDSIDHDAELDGIENRPPNARVAFLHFEGVSPRRFSDLFYAFDSRKDSAGRAKKNTPHQATQKAPELLDNYRQLEAKIVERINQKILNSGSEKEPA